MPRLLLPSRDYFVVDVLATANTLACVLVVIETSIPSLVLTVLRVICHVALLPCHLCNLCNLPSINQSISLCPALVLNHMAVEFNVLDHVSIGMFIAAVSTVLATYFSLSLIANHLYHYTQPNLQRPIVRILLMVPIYAINSFLSLVFSRWSLYLDLLRDCYEAYVVYNFFNLLLAFINADHDSDTRDIELSSFDDPSESRAPVPSPSSSSSSSSGLDEQRVIQILEAKPPMSHPCPMCCLPKFKPGAAFLRLSKRCIFQFILVKPLMVR